jgi:hypothetical protein
MNMRWAARIFGVSKVTLLAAQGFAQAPFYQGKTITVVQGVGTGDLRRKALFPYLRKYIPGNPIIVSEYMPGGGDRKAGNFLYRSARPDGLTLGGVSASLIMNALLDSSCVQYDIDKFIYLGSPISAFHYVIVSRKEGGRTAWRNSAAPRRYVLAPGGRPRYLHRRASGCLSDGHEGRQVLHRLWRPGSRYRAHARRDRRAS